MNMILSIFATKGTKQGKMFCIKGKSNEPIHLEQMLAINYNDKPYYFEVVEIKCIKCEGDDYIYFIANEIGYYNLLSKLKVDIRELVYKSITIVTDSQIIKQIQLLLIVKL